MVSLAMTVYAGGRRAVARNADGKIDVVATIFPPYDFVRAITGDKVNLTMLLPPGAESHSFEPTPQDIIKVQNSDVFIYVGGDSDEWVARILDSMDTSRMKIITLMDCVEVVEELVVEGMQDEEDHGHDNDHEFNPADVADRPMSDFAGSWISGIPLIRNGSLNAYIEKEAEESGVSAAEYRAGLLKRWASDYNRIIVRNNRLSINGLDAEYTYRGFEIVERGNGVSVWYKYQIVNPGFNMPAYLMFSDYGYGHEPEEHHEEEHEEIAHIHLKYGNAGFEDLSAKDEWSAMYFDGTHSNAEIGTFMASHDHEEEVEYDEHVWTSPRNAKLIVQKIADVIKEADPANAAEYEKNTAAYLSKLDDLDASFKNVVNGSRRKTIIFGDRFPFRYFADAYGIDYFAAFPGCSTETEASAATIAFLINKVKSERLPVVFHIELSN
jgi:zinc transport system substrate-binding protein